jgi:cytochrome P450 family 710 subfamily A protein
MKPFKMTDDYTAPAGTMIIPSCWAASMQGYENPDAFDPDRFGPERAEDIKFATNFLVFGHGPHYCVGKEYAQNHLAVFLSRIATSLEWKRVRSDISDTTIYLPTLYPGDSVFGLKWRNAKA